MLYLNCKTCLYLPPIAPMLDKLKVPPLKSSGFNLFSKPTWCNRFNSLAISRMLLDWQSLMLGTNKPCGVSVKGKWN